MKAWIAIFSVALFAGGTCLGVALQPKLAPPPPVAAAPAPVHYPDRLSVHQFGKEVGLTEEQDYELDQILGDTQRDIEALGRSIRAAHERSRERVMAILTDEQKKKLDELVAAERRKRSESEAEKTVKTYAKLLELTPEQTEGLRAALLEARNKKREAFSTGRKHGDHEQGRAAFRQIRDEQNKSIEKALTPAQYQRYLELSELER